MSKSKIVGMMALIVFATGILLVGNAIAGKEGTESFTAGFYSTSKVIAFGEDYIYGSFESFGVCMGNTGKEMTHGVTIRSLGEWQIEKGFYSELGGAVWTLLNGDKIYIKFYDSGKAGETPKGTITILGGTGKCAGIEGSGEYTLHPSAPSEGAAWQGLMKLKFQYKLP